MDASRVAFRNLLVNLVRRDLTVRYKSTFLGFLWSFLKPLALTGIFFVVFDKILEIDLTEQRIDYALFLLVGILSWTFFAGACGEALGVILGNGNLIKKVRLPLVVFPLSCVFSHFIHFLLAQFVLVVMAIAMGLLPSPMFVLVIPIMVLQFLLTFAVSLILSALNVHFRDVGSIWEVLAQIWFYATPVVYPVYQALNKMGDLGWAGWKWVYLANPMTPIVLAYRRVILFAAVGDKPVLELASDRELLLSLVLCCITTAVLLVIGLRVFNRRSRSFADEL